MAKKEITLLPSVGKPDPKPYLQWLVEQLPTLLQKVKKNGALQTEVESGTNNRKPCCTEQLRPDNSNEAGVSDEFWLLIEPMIPKDEPRIPKPTDKRRPGAGRKPHHDRVIFDSIVFILRSGIAWKKLPKSFGCSASAAHRYFLKWCKDGLFDRVWKSGLADHPNLKNIHWRCIHQNQQGEDGQYVSKTFWQPISVAPFTPRRSVQK